MEGHLTGRGSRAGRISLESTAGIDRLEGLGAFLGGFHQPYITPMGRPCSPSGRSISKEWAWLPKKGKGTLCSSHVCVVAKKGEGHLTGRGEPRRPHKPLYSSHVCVVAKKRAGR